MAEKRTEGAQGSPQNERNEFKTNSAMTPKMTQDLKDKHRLIMERALDKTLADSFPASDPPSSIPDPGEEEPFAA
jgi:hypothetical protein